MRRTWCCPAAGAGVKIRVADFTVICSGLGRAFRRHNGMTVLVPVPMSCTPRRNSTLPSGLICASPCVRRLDRRRASRRRRIQSRFHHPGRAPGLLIFFLPAKFFRADLVFALADFVRIVFQPQLQRIHAELAARSSMALSMPKEAGGCPGARNAREEPALTATVDCFTRVFGTA